MLTDFLLWLLVTYNYLLRVLSLYKNSKIQFLHSYLRLPHQNVIKLKHNAMNHIRQTWFKFWQYVIKAKFYRVIVTYRRCLELGLLGKFGRIEVLPWSWTLLLMSRNRMKFKYIFLFNLKKGHFERGCSCLWTDFSFICIYM